MDYLSAIKSAHPLIVCMTNVVTINDVANVILAVGGAPCMSFEVTELAELVSLASAVVANIGTVRMEEIPAFHQLLEEANRKGIPVVLDPAGAGASQFRTQLAQELLTGHHVTILRGNASEISAILGNAGRSQGVDACQSDRITDGNLVYFRELVAEVFKRYHCVASISGAIDVIGDDKKVYYCRNGVPRMTQVTGTGCSLTGVTAAFLAVASDYLEAAAHAVAAMGIAGEIADRQTAELGIGSLHTAIIDILSRLDDRMFQKNARLVLA